MKWVLACLVVGLVVVANAQEFTTAPAKLAKDSYLKTLAQAAQAYKAALESALRQAEARKDSPEVDRIKSALTDLAENQTLNGKTSGPATTLAFKTAKIKSGESIEIGKVAKGDRIVMKYVKGLISVRDEPLQNPDESDRVGCALKGRTGGSIGTIVKIPKGTVEKAFEYTFDTAFENVILSIEGKRPEGEVTYKYALVRTR
jgi:hypothetical protein